MNDFDIQDLFDPSRKNSPFSKYTKNYDFVKLVLNKKDQMNKTMIPSSILRYNNISTSIDQTINEANSSLGESSIVAIREPMTKQVSPSNTNIRKQ